MASDPVGFIAKIATIALTPIVLFYAWAAMHSEHAHKSRAYWGSFWVLLVAAVVLAVGELISVYAQIYGVPAAEAISAVARLSVFLLFLAKIRERVNDSVASHLRKQGGKK